MAQIFHHSTNTIARVSIYGAVILIAILGYAANVVNQTSYVTDVHTAQPQPVALQPQASCGRAWPGLPLLPYLGGSFLLGRHAPDPDLHDVPFADMDERAASGACANELPGLDPHFLDEGQRAA